MLDLTYNFQTIYNKLPSLLDFFKTGVVVNQKLKDAAFYGDTKSVKLCLTDDLVDPASESNYAIRRAAQNGHAEIVKLLLADNRANPAANINQAICLAAENGHTEVVWLLLADERVDPAANSNGAIKIAVQNNHADVIKLLLATKRVNPAANEHCAIRWASQNGDLEAIILSLQYPAELSYVRENLQEFIAKYPAVQSALTSTNEEHLAFRNTFFSLISKPFISTMPYYLAAFQANGIPSDVIAQNIAPHLHPYFERYKDGGLSLVNQSYTLLPGYQQKASAKARLDDNVNEESNYRQTKKPRVMNNEMDVEAEEVMHQGYRNG